MSRETTLADLVVTQLNTAGNGWQQTFTAARKYIVRDDLKEIGTTWHVAVVPVAKKTSILTRTADESTITIDVGIKKRVNLATNTEPDAVLDLAQQIGEFFLRKELTGYRGMDFEQPELWFDSMLEGDRLMLCVVRITFQSL